MKNNLVIDFNLNYQVVDDEKKDKIKELKQKLVIYVFKLHKFWQISKKQNDESSHKKSEVEVRKFEDKIY